MFPENAVVQRASTTRTKTPYAGSELRLSSETNDAPPTAVQRLTLAELAAKAKGTLGSAVDSVVGAASSALPIDALLEKLGRLKNSAGSAEAQASVAGQAHLNQTQTELTHGPNELQQRLQGAADSGGRKAAGETSNAGAEGPQIRQGAQGLRQEGATAGDLLGSLGSVLSGALSPAMAIAQPEQVTAAGAQVSQVAQSTAGAGAGPTVGTGVASGVQKSLGPGAQPTWTCDLSEVTAMAGGVEKKLITDAVSLVEGATGGTRLAGIGRFAGDMGRRINGVAAHINGHMSTLSTKTAARFRSLVHPMKARAQNAANAVAKGFDNVRAGISNFATMAKGAFLKRWDAFTANAGKHLDGLVNDAGKRLSSFGATAGRLLGPIAKALLPAWAYSFLTSIPTRIEGLAKRLRGWGQTLAESARRAKATAFAATKEFVDAKLQEWEAQRRIAQRVINEAAKAVEAAGGFILGLIPTKIKTEIARLAAAARAQAARFDVAADKVGAKVRDGTCAVLGATAGPCVTQYLPDLGGGFNNSVKLIAKGDVTIPLEEIGVPANLKVGTGSTVEVSVKSGIYAVKVTGDATLFLNETVGNDQHAGVSGGPGLTGSLAQAWRALSQGGSPPTPGAAAPGVANAPTSSPSSGGAPSSLAALGGAPVAGGAPAAVAAAPSGEATKVEANAGLKGSTESEWRFDSFKANSSCEGIGGLLTLLSGLGAASVLPQPFNQFGPAAVHRGFMKELQYSKFSAGLAGEVKVDLKTEGLGRLAGRAAGDISENIETHRDPATGELVTNRTRTLTGELDATALGPFTAGGLEAFRIFLTGQGILRLTLAYKGDEIVPTTIGGAIRASLGAKNLDPNLLASKIASKIPEAADEIRRAFNEALPGMEGPREVELALTVGRVYDGLEPLFRALDIYFKGPIDKINVDGVVAILKDNLAKIKPEDHLKVELSQTQRRTVEGGATESQGGIAVGANVTLGAEHTVSRVWTNYQGVDDIVEAAAAGKKAKSSIVEPKKPDGGKDRKTQAPTGTEDDPILMLWAKPLSRYAQVRLDTPDGRKQFSRNTPTALPPPDQSTKIGVTEPFGAPGQKLRRPDTPTPRGGQEKEFVKALTRHGFGAFGEDGFDDHSPDHVRDLAWGGPDTFSNMWPLDKETNTKAGAYHSFRQVVECNFADDPPTQPPRRLPLSDPRFRGVFFKIKGVADPKDL